MKHSTNYFNTLIEIAEDCPITEGMSPPIKGDKKTVANLQFEILNKQPYVFTSDEVLFSVFAIRKKFLKDELKEAKTNFFSRGQPCFRASPLTKRYGWGVHANQDGKIALFGAEEKAYKKLQGDDSVVKKKAMRSKRV